MCSISWCAVSCRLFVSDEKLWEESYNRSVFTFASRVFRTRNTVHISVSTAYRVANAPPGGGLSYTLICKKYPFHKLQNLSVLWINRNKSKSVTLVEPTKYKYFNLSRNLKKKKLNDRFPCPFIYLNLYWPFKRVPLPSAPVPRPLTTPGPT